VHERNDCMIKTGCGGADEIGGYQSSLEMRWLGGAKGRECHECKPTKKQQAKTKQVDMQRIRLHNHTLATSRLNLFVHMGLLR
jgi:hypothetical protein